MQSYQTERTKELQNEQTDNETFLVEKIKSCFLLMKHKKVHFSEVGTETFNIRNSAFE